MAKLADILVTLTLDTSEFSKQLKEVGQDLHNFKNQVNQVTSTMNKEFTKNMTEMSESMKEVSESTSTSSQHITHSTEIITRQVNKVSNSAKYLSRTAGTSFQDMQRVLQASTDEYNRFGDTGRRVSREVSEQFSALPSHVKRYVQRLKDAGQATDGFARLNEMYSVRIIGAMREAHDYLQHKTTQSQRLMKSFAEDTNLSPLTNGFLRLSDSLERSSREGTALGIALKRVGNDTSLKNLKDQIKFVEQGIARARGAFIGFGVASLLAVGGMTLLASTVDERVAPAFENLKATWVDAMMPFITTFANGLLNVMAFANAVGELVNKFSEAHPVIFSMVMSILMLTLVLGTLLAPLAVTGILTEGLAASFTALWATIGPFVTGMLAVVGVALALATAIVVLYASIKELWKYSEAFREAFIAIWESVKDAVVNKFVAPVVDSWENLKNELSNLVAVVTGKTGTMKSLWEWLGDIIAIVVNAIADVTLPIFHKAMEILGLVVSKTIDAMAVVVKWMADFWKKHGDEIEEVVRKLWGYIETAFTEVKNFLAEISPQITEIVKKAFELIKEAVDFAIKYIVPVVEAGFKFILATLQWIMPTLVSMVKDTWENIKSLITNALNIIQNAIEFFTNILQGKWSEAWENVKEIVKSAVQMVYDFVEVWVLGKVLKIFKGFGDNIKNALSDVTEKMVAPFKAGYEKIMDYVEKVRSAIQTMKNFIKEAVDLVTGIGSANDSPSSPKSRSVSPPQKNARGNVFTGASLLGGNQIVGEAGAEVVMPIERRRYMRPYASMVASLINNNNGRSSRGEGIVQNITINSTTPLSPSEIARKNLQTARRLALEWEV